MFCDDCKQNPASVHLTQMFQGKKVETHLCEACAAKKGAMILDLDHNFSIAHLLGSFLGNPYDIQNAAQSKTLCPNCGMSFANIRQTGKIGCSECYQTFEQELEPTLRRINVNSEHIGKIPLRGGEQTLLRKDLNTLKIKLQEAVASEQYEKAVAIRDQIMELNKQLE